MELIPEGHYNAVATANGGELVQFGSSSRGTKQVVVHFRLLDGEHAGKVLPWWGYFSEKTWRRTLESLRYAGFTGDDLAAINDQMLDQMVSLTISHESDDKGIIRARVAWVNAPGGGGVTLKQPMTASELKAFSLSMRAHCGKVAAVAGVRSDGLQQVASRDNLGWDAPPPGDDDIPF